MPGDNKNIVTLNVPKKFILEKNNLQQHGQRFKELCQEPAEVRETLLPHSIYLYIYIYTFILKLHILLDVKT